MKELMIYNDYPQICKNLEIVDLILSGDGFFLNASNKLLSLFEETEDLDNPIEEYKERGMIFSHYYKSDEDITPNIYVCVSSDFFIEIDEFEISFKIGNISLVIENNIENGISEDSIDSYKKILLNLLNEVTEISADSLENYFKLLCMINI